MSLGMESGRVAPSDPIRTVLNGPVRCRTGSPGQLVPVGDIGGQPVAGQCPSAEKNFKKALVFFLSKFVDKHENVCYSQYIPNEEDNKNE